LYSCLPPPTSSSFCLSFRRSRPRKRFTFFCGADYAFHLPGACPLHPLPPHAQTSRMRPSFHPHHGRPAAEDLPDQNHCQPAGAARPRAPRTPLRLGLSFAVHAASLRMLTPSAQQKRRGLQKPRPEVLPPSTLNRSHGTVLTAGSLHSPGSGAAAARDRATAALDEATAGRR
jgi:hypothetical protein